MIIEREGRKFDLSEDELMQAHIEYMHRLDMKDVVAFLDEYDDNGLNGTYHISRDQLTDELISDIATEMRSNMEKYKQNMPEARKDAVKDKLFEFVNHCRISDKRPPTFIPIVLIRNRPCEREQWADTFYMRVNHPDPGGKIDAGFFLRDCIARWMITVEGWAANIKSCLDFNWGDFICDFPFGDEKYNLFWDLPSGTRHEVLPVQTISVDQDEHLAPDSVRGLMSLYKDGEQKPFYVVWGQADFQTGEFTPDSDIDDSNIKAATHGNINIDGNVFDLDPDEDFMCLKRG